MKKHARFFCENCQTEVKGNARFCGHCGRFFAAVKCPACGKTGASHTFAHGCPNCGYAVGSSKSSTDKENSFQENSKINKKNSRKKFNFQKIFSGFDKNVFLSPRGSLFHFLFCTFKNFRKLLFFYSL